jgi:hypothetical protein
MAKTFKTVEQINSAGIAAEMLKHGILELEFIGRFLPVEPMLNVSEADSAIYIYRFPSTYEVASTNGDPVWEAQDQQVWDGLMAEYGVSA